MSTKQNNNQIEITDLIGDVVGNTISCQEKYLTTEECQNVRGGFIRFPIISIIVCSGEDLCFSIPY